ncbi:helicase C-terminal domain-containing protein [Gracilinema caldarium]|uniref:DNA 5'-3' helicase n=1 Tax=Gracilinema caldarium (strain ATCC 51460 / DSM 7334 / H1) TaxID=744872 RepID=F8F0Q1_GRAC1|nr:helicase C-terminal domain-containing protein [Gracilinema caldarium]AEJ19758.1 helicase c2 [Gracilinema caldarium DSM 7334]
MRSDKRLSSEAIEILREEIADANGNEVFALGFLDATGMVDRIKIAARGHESAVLALPVYYEDADVLIHNHPSGLLSPSDNDLAIASRAAEAGLGSFIVNNEVSRLYVVAEPIPKKEKKILDEDKLVSALEPGGAIANRLSKYESRPSQLDLMRLIIKGFNTDAIVCAEAGTGVGKSFAYLLPAMAYAILNKERVLISTATITLQQQLYEKDIPLVAGILKKPVKAVLIKGRSNYLCFRRLQDALHEGDLDLEQQAEQLEAIVRWSETTSTGSKSELPFVPDETLWSRICSEPDLCLAMHCPERERCFVQALKREAADAQILVVNHHLLFADLSARSDGAGYEQTVVLPPYQRIIVDEAHTMEHSATSFFSETFSRMSLMRLMNRLYRKKRMQSYGLAVRLASFLDTDQFLETIDGAIQTVKASMDQLDMAAQTLLGTEGVFRLTSEKKQLVSAQLLPAMRELRQSISKLCGTLHNALETLHEDLQDDPLIWELKAIIRRIEQIGSIAGSFIEFEEKGESVFYIELMNGRRNDGFARFSITPIVIATSLQEALWSQFKTIICVSATLTIDNRFDYWKRRVGLEFETDRNVLSGIFPSPFPYDRAVLLAAPTDSPLPDEAGYDAFVNTAVSRLIAASGGSALVLFTSYTALKQAYEYAREELQGLGIRCLKQGDQDRSRLLQDFLQDESSVLFATDSFWEGVDAPGNTLRLVILCRLPFRIPSDPVYEARCEALEREGRSAFMELSLPEAVMKLKQGFGRLMRTSSDHGVVAILDGRILKKRYGSLFIRSLPETRQAFGDFDLILEKTETFLQNR